MALDFHSGFEMGDFTDWDSVTGSPSVEKHIFVLGTSTTDSSGDWSNDDNLIDGDTASETYISLVGGVWSNFLQVNFTSVTARSIRYYAATVVGASQIDIDVYDGSGWTHVFQGDIAILDWVVKTFTEQTVTAARVRLYAVTDITGKLAELQVGEIPKTGVYAMRCNPSAATAYAYNGQATEKANTFYLYIASTPGANAYIYGTDNGNGIVLNTDRTLSVNSATGTKRVTGTTVLALNTWYRVSVSNSSATPSVKLYLNGTQEGSTYATAMTFAGNLGVVTSTTADLYFDDYVSDTADQTADLGDIRVELSQPNAVGNYNDFDNLVPSAIHWENVDNNPQDVNVDNDFNEIEASGTYRDSYGIENSSTIGLGGSDTIEAVSTWARLLRNGGGGTDHMIMVRDNGSDYLTADLALTTSFAWFNKYDADLPNGGGAWTQGRFDAFEVGVYRSTAQDMTVSNMQVMVAYKVVVVGAEWKQLQYTSEPPTPNAWNQLKHTVIGGWNQIKYEGE